MKTYIIFDLSTDEVLGTVNAYDVISAEYKACGIWTTVNSDYIAAFTADNQ